MTPFLLGLPFTREIFCCGLLDGTGNTLRLLSPAALLRCGVPLRGTQRHPDSNEEARCAHPRGLERRTSVVTRPQQLAGISKTPSPGGSVLRHTLRHGVFDQDLQIGASVIGWHSGTLNPNCQGIRVGRRTMTHGVFDQRLQKQGRYTFLA